ncbi:MAG: hypothetical protein ACHQFW_04580 [Chitinophagales bacterium]
MIRGFVFILVFYLISVDLFSQEHLKVYLIPGQGSDERIFKNLVWDEFIDTVHIKYELPLVNETMEEYAVRISKQIDTTEKFAIIGVSLGGMIACELADIIQPEKAIIISSASSSEEIPAMYKFFKRFPVHQEISSSIFKYSTFILQPLYEPDRSLEKETCVNMIHDKDALFIKRAVNLIVSWNRKEADNKNKPIVHIHGDADNTLPVENIEADYIITNGSHMMTLTRADTLSVIINLELEKCMLVDN